MTGHTMVLRFRALGKIIYPCVSGLISCVDLDKLMQHDWRSESQANWIRDPWMESG